MSNSDATPGIVAIILGTLVASVAITQVTGSYMHWPFVLAGIAAGLLAVRSINR
jgi:hypothetical protein